jgi:hypothetical protein
VSADLQRVEEIIDASGQATRIELLLPVGVRPRQLTVRTLLVGMVLAMLHGRDALLTSVHNELLELPEADRRRLAVTADWKNAEHELTYRQLEYTYRLINTRLAKDTPDGSPSQVLSETLDALLEASVRVLGEPDSTSYALDWTAHETWSRPPPKHAAERESQTQPAADPDRPGCSDREASWGHRTVTHPAHTKMFFGYYLQALTVVRDEHGPEVPELARRMHLASPQHDPPAQIIPIIQRTAANGIEISDLLVDSGYSYRQPDTFALPIRKLGAQLIMDLHPNDRGVHGTHHGAICANGNLYCPATPTNLLELAPLPRGATIEQTETHDRLCAELARYKLSPITTYDNDGYRRVICPAAHGKLRCPLPPAPCVHDSAPRPPAGAQATRAPADMLLPEDDHRATVGQRQNRPKTRLAIGNTPPLLQPPHRRRAHLRHPHRPRHQRPLPRLVPTHRTRPDRPIHRHRPDRPQHPRPRRLHRPPRRKPAARRQRVATQAPPAPKANRRGPDRHRQRAAPTHHARRLNHAEQRAPPSGDPPAPNGPNDRPTAPNQALPATPSTTQPPHCLPSAPNVNIPTGQT